ncbi:high-affinity methionine permease [Colletotrichum tofieldiae]|nr:high-affinity methionine permease [Colletotrichum tofieldiae]GKT81393.1 high-affinity methionine permease [Colletotrichum tofieldiae]
MTGKQFRPFLSIFCALVYMCGGLYPVIANWVPPSGSLPSTVKPWYLVPTVLWVIIGIGICWFFSFVLFTRYIKRKEHSVFVVKKRPKFKPAETSGRGSEASGTGTDLIQVHETVYLSWVGKEALRSRRPVFEDSKQVDGSVREIF